MSEKLNVQKNMNKVLELSFGNNKVTVTSEGTPKFETFISKIIDIENELINEK